jgi:hypothetical protein
MDIQELSDKVDIDKLVKDTGLYEDDLFEAFKVSQVDRLVNRMNAAKTISHSWEVYQSAEYEKVDQKILKRLLDIHESRCMVVVDQAKIESVDDLRQIIIYGPPDGPAFTKAAELLLVCMKTPSQIGNLYNQLKNLRKSTNVALLNQVLGKLGVSSAVELKKPVLSLDQLSYIRTYASYLPSRHVLNFAEKRFSKAFKEYLAKPLTLKELRPPRGWANGDKEFSLIESRVYKLVLKECKDDNSSDSSFKKSCQVLNDHFNLIGSYRPQIRCMSALAKRAMTFEELWHVFDSYTRGDYANSLRRRMVNKLIDLARTPKQLMRIYEIREVFTAELVTDSQKNKIIRKLADMYKKEAVNDEAGTKETARSK